MELRLGRSYLRPEMQGKSQKQTDPVLHLGQPGLEVEEAPANVQIRNELGNVTVAV